MMSAAELAASPQLPLIIAHIIAGAIAILAAAAALFLKKGSGPHRAAGAVFALAMLATVGIAATVAAIKDQPMNLVVSAFVAYLVITSWVAARTPVTRPDGVLVTGLLWVSAVATTALLFGYLAVPPLGPSGPPAAPWVKIYYAFGSVAAWAALCDLSVVWRGGLTGANRISRHLWRMSAAAFLASSAFFNGQAHLIPQALHGPLLKVLADFPLAFLLFWLIRVRFRPWNAKPETAA